MIAALITLTILALCGVIFLAFEFRRVTGLYENLFSIMESDRDTLKNEVITLRQALFPQMPRGIGPASEPKPRPTAALTPVNMINRFIPWRRQAKILQQQHNSKQAGRDATAAAIQESKQNAQGR